jgi:hypothetical protein
MSRRTPPRTTTPRSPGPLLAGLLVVGLAIVAARGYHVLAPSSATAASPTSVAAAPSTLAAPVEVPPTEPRVLPRAQRGPLGEADGAIPDGTTVFDDDVPGVANLDADLLGALRRAGALARRDGVQLLVDSGWRSPAYQQHLLDDAISKYGSAAEAARWVATPDTSEHVSGDAVDIGPARASSWLARHGAAYGLCQIYRNEPWHYEVRAAAVEHGCPPMYADPSRDPRLQR